MKRSAKHFRFGAALLLAALSAGFSSCGKQKDAPLYTQEELEYAQAAAGQFAEMRMQRAWMKATSANTVAAYREFLQAYPQSVLATHARRQIEQLTPQPSGGPEGAGEFAYQRGGPLRVTCAGAYSATFYARWYDLCGRPKQWSSRLLLVGMDDAVILPWAVSGLEVWAVAHGSSKGEIFRLTDPSLTKPFSVGGSLFNPHLQERE